MIIYYRYFYKLTIILIFILRFKKQVQNKYCNHNLLNLKELDSSVYCKTGQELYYVACKGKECNKIFIPNEDKPKFTDKNYSPCWPTNTHPVKACFNVLDCGHALCYQCYISQMLENDNASNKRTSRRR